MKIRSTYQRSIREAYLARWLLCSCAFVVRLQPKASLKDPRSPRGHFVPFSCHPQGKKSNDGSIGSFRLLFILEPNPQVISNSRSAKCEYRTWVLCSDADLMVFDAEASSFTRHRSIHDCPSAPVGRFGSQSHHACFVQDLDETGFRRAGHSPPPRNSFVSEVLLGSSLFICPLKRPLLLRFCQVLFDFRDLFFVASTRRPTELFEEKLGNGVRQAKRFFSQEDLWPILCTTNGFTYICTSSKIKSSKLCNIFFKRCFKKLPFWKRAQNCAFRLSNFQKLIHELF